VIRSHNARHSRSFQAQVNGKFSMFAGRLTRPTIRALDWLAAGTLSPEDMPAHQRTGRRGEGDAYFYLRRRGDTIIARNDRSGWNRGELDSVGWPASSEWRFDVLSVYYDNGRRRPSFE
jgi:hypothetical protein